MEKGKDIIPLEGKNVKLSKILKSDISILWTARFWFWIKRDGWTDRKSVQCYLKVLSGNRNKGKGNCAGLAWESQSYGFADKFGKRYTHSFDTDTHHDYSQGNCRTMLSIIIKLE